MKILTALLILGLALTTTAHAAQLVGVADLDTGDVTCPMTLSPIYHKTWTSAYAMTVYIQRGWATLWPGGRLDSKTEGWYWVGGPGSLAHVPLIQMGGAIFGPAQPHNEHWDYTHAPIAVDPGESLTLNGQCINYNGTNTPRVVWRMKATFWLYDGP